jgi:predicted HicB family RNase H-like nuclease
MQYRGLEHMIPLRLSNNAVAMLTLEAQVREISLGQLVGMLIEAAMAQDLSRVLDKNPTDEPE